MALDRNSKNRTVFTLTLTVINLYATRQQTNRSSRLIFRMIFKKMKCDDIPQDRYTNDKLKHTGIQIQPRSAPEGQIDALNFETTVPS